MQPIRTMWIAAVLVPMLGVASAHAGAPLSSPPLPSGLGANYYLCQVVNTGSKAVEVKLDLIETTGQTVINTATVTLNPGQLSLVTTNAGVNMYCKATGLTAKSGTIALSAYNGSTPVMFVTAP